MKASLKRSLAAPLMTAVASFTLLFASSGLAGPQQPYKKPTAGTAKCTQRCSDRMRDCMQQCMGNIGKGEGGRGAAKVDNKCMGRCQEEVQDCMGRCS